MFKTGNTVLVKNTVNSIYAGDTGMVLDSSDCDIKDMIFIAFEGGKSTEWFSEDDLIMIG